MFSAFKRFASKGDNPPGTQNSPLMPPGHQSMSTSLQRKFARGVQYNMKVIIKGDRNVGKTCLFYRLQGLKFIEEYIPTEEIQATSIQWNYKATDDIVKVEVWDVVDRGKKKKRFDGLKLDNSQLEISDEAALDAEFLDVYKGTNGVILMMDITKSWTFNYVQEELPKIPEHIPVIVLANHCDMSHHRTVSQNQISFFIESLQSRTAQVRYAESSMRNGFGLKLLHKFFNLPFLQLQRETLLQQLNRNKTEIDLTTQELDMYLESDEADYTKFIDNLVSKRRQVAESNSPRYLTNSPSQQNTSSPLNNNSQNDRMKRSQSGPIVIGAGQPIPVPSNFISNQQYASSVNQKENLPNTSESFSPRVDSNVNVENPKIKSNLESVYMDKASSKQPESMSKLNTTSSFISKLFGNKNEDQAQPSSTVRGSTESNPITSVEEFCPDGGKLDKSFLEDVDKSDIQNKNMYQAVDSDSDGEKDNPLVARFQDDLDPDDEFAFNNSTNNSKQYTQVSDNSQAAIFKNEFSKTDNLSKDKFTKTVVQETIQIDIRKTYRRCSQSSNSDVNELGSELKNLVVDKDLDAENSFDVTELTSESVDNWLGADSKWRRSPEGGEDSSQIVDCSGSIEDTGSVTSSNINAELLTFSKYSRNSSNSESDIISEKKCKSKHSSNNKSEKKNKKSKEKKKEHSKKNTSSVKSDNEKDKKIKSKKRSRDETSDRRKQKNDELEEFLNGPSDVPVDRAYEAF